MCLLLTVESHSPHTVHSTMTCSPLHTPRLRLNGPLCPLCCCLVHGTIPTGPAAIRLQPAPDQCSLPAAERGVPQQAGCQHVCGQAGRGQPTGHGGAHGCTGPGALLQRRQQQPGATRAGREAGARVKRPGGSGSVPGIGGGCAARRRGCSYSTPGSCCILTPVLLVAVRRGGGVAATPCPCSCCIA